MERVLERLVLRNPAVLDMAEDEEGDEESEDGIDEEGVIKE